MTELLCFIAGLLVGLVITCLGLYLGFKASYDIRNSKNGVAEELGLIRPSKDPAEFDLLNEQDKEEKEEELYNQMPNED